MEQKILILSGKKQAGKNTISNFIHGSLMVGHGVTRTFNINEDGKLMVFASTEETQGMGELDITRSDKQFTQYASAKIWPYVRNYSFADSLKEVCIRLFGLKYEQCFGSDTQKNSKTSIKWSDIKFTLPPKTVGELKKTNSLEDTLTAREFMQHFGTNICRRIYTNCWAEDCLKRIVMDGSELAIVTDCRFPNEIEVAREYGAKIVRLNRQVYEDSHDSETALDKYPEDYYDLYLDNQNMTIKEQCEAVMRKLFEWGWLEVEVK